MAARHFENPYGEAPKLIGAEGRRTLLEAASAALKAVKSAAKAHRDLSGGGVYVGVGGVALTMLRVAQQLSRGVEFEHGPYLRKQTPEKALEAAEAFAGDGIALAPARRATFLEGPPGPLAVQAVALALRGDVRGSRARVEALEALRAASVAALAPGECELLYGRAGYLYSLLWLETQLGPGTIDGAAVRELVAHLLRQGAEGAQESEAAARFGLMYRWHDKQYLGAAHGLCGIVYVLLHCLPVVRAVKPSGEGVAALTQACDALVASLLPSGNLPSSLGSREDRLVQWCHGAPGLIITMLKAHEVIGGGGDGGGGGEAGSSEAGGGGRGGGDPGAHGRRGSRYLDAARKAAHVVWRRGLLRKGLGLCHGISGNGYALLALWRATGEEPYLAMAQAFALFAAEHWEELYEVPDRPASLYEGLAGAVCFWLDVLDPANSRWPGAEL